MSRYIDADAWWKAVQKHYTNGDCADNDRYELGINVGITKSRNVMMNAPSIDIVRCRKCSKRMTDDCPMCNECNFGKVPTDDDDFCSYGERREP